jgi:putative ABC transport system ATP-binding protein
MVTHDPIAASYADRTLILADGRIVHELGKETPETISSFMLAMESRS